MTPRGFLGASGGDPALTEGNIMTDPKYKTVTIKATMETDLYLTVNVPAEWDDERIYEYGCNADGAEFLEDGDYSGGWYVSTDIIHEEYDPDHGVVDSQ